MPTVTSHNREEWILREMARRSGKKYEPEEKKSIYDTMDAKEIKEHETMLQKAKQALQSEEE
jgi:hypothetical protein